MRRTADKLDRPELHSGAIGIRAETFQFQMRAWQDQAELLDGTQKIMAAWTKRRQGAVEASSRTFQAICGCKRRRRNDHRLC